MKRRLLILLITISYISCENRSSTIETVYSKSETKNIFNNSKIIRNSNINSFERYQITEGNQIVVIYIKEDFKFVDATDYEAKYKDVLVFEFNSDENEFDYKDEDLSILNCQYSSIVYSKSLLNAFGYVKKGKIKGKKLDSKTWLISVNIKNEIEVKFEEKLIIK